VRRHKQGRPTSRFREVGRHTMAVDQSYCGFETGVNLRTGDRMPVTIPRLAVGNSPVLTRVTSSGTGVWCREHRSLSIRRPCVIPPGRTSGHIELAPVRSQRRRGSCPQHLSRRKA